MIDLHSHILPGIDDGAPNWAASMAIAEMAAQDGIEVMAATPHFMPGLYDNNTPEVMSLVDQLNDRLADKGVNLTVVCGGDVHIRPDLLSVLRSGEVPTIHGSQYFLFEPSHITVPQRLADLVHNLHAGGFEPILTHPERLKWIEGKYDLMCELEKSGVWMQITCGSLTGRFGKRPKYWAERMLAEGRVKILATDAHNVTSRPPLMAEAFDIAVREVGLDEARNLVLTRPLAVLDHADSNTVAGVQRVAKTKKRGFLHRLFGTR